MPTTWYYIKGCPFPDECNKYKTTSKKKQLTFSGLTREDAVEKCAEHLRLSELHRITRSMAVEIAQEQDMYALEEPTTEEEEEPPAKSARTDSYSGGQTASSSGGQAASSSGGQAAHETMLLINDAEEAVRKAQNFALSAAQAFGEVAEKLNQVKMSMA